MVHSLGIILGVLIDSKACRLVCARLLPLNGLESTLSFLVGALFALSTLLRCSLLWLTGVAIVAVRYGTPSAQEYRWH